MKRTLFSFIYFAVLFGSLSGQNGSNDGMFNPSDKGFNNGGGFNSNVNSIVVQPDKKILIAGSFTSYRNLSFWGIFRFDENYNIDTTFHSGTGFSKENGTSIVYNIALQSDGKIIVGGDFDFYNDRQANNLIRLNPDGSVDTSFKVGLACNKRVLALLVIGNDKLFVGGDFTKFNGSPLNRLVLLNRNGERDTTFKIGSGFDGYVRTLAIHNNNLLVGGRFSSYWGRDWAYFIKLKFNGGIDTSFKIPSFIDGPVVSLSVLSNNKILIGGSFYGYVNHLARLNANGTRDMSFHLPIQGNSNSYVMTILPTNDKIYAGGYFTSITGQLKNLIRIDTSGLLDTTFKISSELQPIIGCISSKDTELLAGSAGAPFINDYFARISTVGEHIDCSEAGTGFNSAINCMVKDAKGFILVGGDFTFYNSKKARRLVRIDEDGNIDFSLKSESGFDASVYALAIQPDGKILVGGNFSKYQNQNSPYIVRLNADGSMDTTFKAPYINAAVFALAVQGEKIIVGCNSALGVRRLNSDGSQDLTFHLGALYCINYQYSFIKSVSVQKDGKILIGGQFDEYDFIERNNIARLNSNGTLDQSFNDGPLNPGHFPCGTFRGVDQPVYNLTISSDSSIYVGGDFTITSYTRKNRILRYDRNGNLDSRFETGYDGTNGKIKSILPLPDTYVMLGGEFTKFYGTKSPGLILVDNSGRIDDTFNTGSGFNGSVNCMIPVSDKKILIAGSFTSFNGIGRNRIARINYIPRAPNIEELLPLRTVPYSVSPNPSTGLINLKFSSAQKSMVTITVMDFIGVSVSSIEERTEHGINEFQLDLSGLTKGVYLIQVKTDQATETKKIIIE